MTAPTLDAEPACPGSAEPAPPSDRPDPSIHAERRSFDSISQATWDRMAARSPWATPFSSWAFQRAWWDGYGENAHEETLLVCRDVAGADGDPISIVPLMHRHEVEPSDALTHTTIRHGRPRGLTPVPGSARAVFFGASYHADYATMLAAPSDLPTAAAAVADYLASPASRDWDAVDFRRLRCADPAGDALAAALGAREIANGWTLNVDREDVCPVVTLPDVDDIEAYLATLGKKERHEVRRKVRRAEAVGEVRLRESTDPLVELDAFIDLHQKRWGADGLFPPTKGGDQSRVFIRRLFELFGPDGGLGLTFLTVGDHGIASGIHFETRDGLLFYNAGIDPDARALSPGVLLTYAYIRRSLDRGLRRFDFLRGDEPYKYEWGAVDEPIQRLLVRRGA
ncbi:MAG TPA: GNAT family N-acetyltransferase [Candidatus Limnocylindrales bacterium]|jgi:CelD/BcsL family acetyltransferase involved in cellulose biosynthesis|nr:GNAT family N-acetyltransferase [Candidatus Limnocylindrales bacterium]